MKRVGRGGCKKIDNVNSSSIYYVEREKKGGKEEEDEKTISLTLKMLRYGIGCWDWCKQQPPWGELAN